MGALIIIGTGVAGILLAATASQLASEFRDWTPHLTDWLINRAVRRLPSDFRERMAEEWREFVSDTPGHIAKLVRAAGLGLAARRVALELEGVGLLEHVCSRTFALVLLIFFAPLMALMTIALMLREGPIFEKSSKEFYHFRLTANDPFVLTLFLKGVQPLPSLWNFVKGDAVFPLRELWFTLRRTLP
jgi:hypothetical protein